MATMLPPSPVFNINSSTIAEDWLEWELAWNAYKVATGVDENTLWATQVVSPITVIGAEARRVYHTAYFEADQRHELEHVIQMEIGIPLVQYMSFTERIF